MLLPSILSRDICKNKLSLENAYNEQSDLLKMFGDLNNGRNSYEKMYFLKNVKISLKSREEDLNGFERTYFQYHIHTIFNACKIKH